METVTGYRDPLMDFCDAMSRWFSCYRAAECGRRKEERRGGDGNVKRCPRLPVDQASPHWFLHVLDCSPISAKVKPRLSLASLDKSDLECTGQRLFLVTDGAGVPLGFDLLEGGTNGNVPVLRIVGLLRQCMEAPLGRRGARRPLTLTVGDRQIHRILSGNALSALRVELSEQCFTGWAPKEGFAMRWPPIRHCHVCKKHAFEAPLRPCPKCQALLYCSEQCVQADWSKSPADVSHQHCCPLLGTFMSHCSQLADMPFTYTAETTSPDFDVEHFLSSRGLNSGYWLQQSMLVYSAFQEVEPVRKQPRESSPAELAAHRQPFGPLQESEMMLSCSPPTAPSLNTPLVSWLQYYKWRGFELSSPVAVLLSCPLTIYYIITSLVPRDFPELNILKKQSLKIHIIESEREFNMLLTFWELSDLLPHVTFELLFVGEKLPKDYDEQQLLLQRKDGHVTMESPSMALEEKTEKKSIRVRICSRAYHLFQGPKPNLVIGFRSGFGLGDSWLSTLPRLQALKVPAYFCEPSEVSCVSSQQVMSAATGGSLSPPTLNPFHCPLRITSRDSYLPCYSNAFVFHLIYKASPAAKRDHSAAAPERPLLPHVNAACLPSASPSGALQEDMSKDGRVKLSRKERKQAARNTSRRRK
ncbi:ZMY15 protein, partial [Atractosteus spatula]|nr:ZMY15 protein [Atractosteus spatula]